MHDYYCEKGVPENAEFITAEVSALPFDTSFLDTAVSTMTYHEFAGSDALQELARVVRPAVVSLSLTGQLKELEEQVHP